MKRAFLYFLISTLGSLTFAQSSKEILNMAMNHELPIDTNYLPVDRFHYKFSGKSITDSIRVYFYIEYLKALDEPPIYCCKPESMIRILTLPSFKPATITKIYSQNDSLKIEIKTANKVQIDESHYDPSQLDKKEQNKWFKVYRSGARTREDSILLSKGYYLDTIDYTSNSEFFTISKSDWISLFNTVNNDYYKLVTAQDEDGAMSDGTNILVEVNSQLGYHVLTRQLNYNEERQLLRLIYKVNQLTEN
jgi:hypothetical protein